MKLYIPTCSLNFNNIFSTESISPIAYYQKRGFGISRFFPVVANNLDNAITLYSKYPRYSVEKTDIENSPIVIEIDSRDLPDNYIKMVKVHKGVSVYICNKTIYLNPFHCHIYFNSLTEEKRVLTKAEQSLENKFSKLYSSAFIVKKTSYDLSDNYDGNLFNPTVHTDFSWSKEYVDFDSSDILEEYSYDSKIDKIKGFLYCYLIGANMSVSKETGRLKSIAKSLRNTISAVFNSPDKRPSAAQDETLVNGIKEFNEIYFSKDPSKRHLDQRLRNNPLGLNAENCIQLLKHFDLFEEFCSKFHITPVYDAWELWKCLEDPSAYDQVMERLHNAVCRIEKLDIAGSRKNKLKDLVSVDENLHPTIEDNSINPEFYQRLVCSQINGDYLKIASEKNVEKPLATAFNGGRILKSIMKDKWETSQVSLYIASLLKHFSENVSFNLHAYDNNVIQSFAAFCQKGDDIDRLSEYLTLCGFSDYRLAYGLYGATHGFATLPKTFTSGLIDGDSEYFKDTYITIYAQLHGIKIEDTDIKNIPEDDDNWKKDIRGFAEKIIKKDKSKLLESLDAAIIQNGTNRDYSIFLENLKKYEGWTTKKNGPCSAWKKMQKHYILDCLKHKSKKSSSIQKNNTPKNCPEPKQPELFHQGVRHQEPPVPTRFPHLETPNQKSILEDTSWIDECAKLIADSNAEKQFREDIKWFVENHKDSYYDERKKSTPGQYAKFDKSNTTVYGQLDRFLRKRPTWLKKHYSRIPIDQIMQHIAKKYGI